MRGEGWKTVRRLQLQSTPQVLGSSWTLTTFATSSTNKPKFVFIRNCLIFCQHTCAHTALLHARISHTGNQRRMILHTAKFLFHRVTRLRCLHMRCRCAPIFSPQSWEITSPLWRKGSWAKERGNSGKGKQICGKGERNCGWKKL